MRRSPFSQTRGTKAPTSIVFVDTETLPRPVGSSGETVLHELRVGVACYLRLEGGKATRETWFKFQTIDEFWSWIETKTSDHRPLWLVAHNAGFDFTVLGLWDRVAEKRLYFTPIDSKGKRIVTPNGKGFRRSGLVILEDPPTIIALYNRSGQKLIVTDSLNYWRTSLASMGKSLGKEKLEFPSFEESDEVWFRYCRMDVEIVRDSFLALVNWVSDEDLGSFALTAASQAMTAFRHRFTTNKINRHQNETVYALERSGYYGGEVRCWYVGFVAERGPSSSHRPSDSKTPFPSPPVGPVFQYDVCSLYPHVMAENVFPVELLEHSEPAGWNADPPAVDLAATIARVVVKTKTSDYPVQVEGRRVSARGQFSTVLCGPELLRAMKRKEIYRWGQWSTYRLAPLFASYVRFFWAKRMEARKAGDTLRESLCKLMLNSLYGKFGQRTPGWRFVTDHPWDKSYAVTYNADQRTGVVRKLRSLAGRIEEDINFLRHQTHLVEGEAREALEDHLGSPEHSKSFPAIAGFVTSYAREFMRSIWAVIGEGHLFYQATDSVAVDAVGRDRIEALQTTGKLQPGALRLECEGPDALFESVGHYRIGTKYAHGGIRSKAQLLYGKTYQQDRFQSLKSILDGTPPAGVQVSQVVIHSNPVYRHGEVTSSGWTSPFSLMADSPSSVVATL